MRLYVRFLLIVCGLAVGASGFMPWVRDVKPKHVPLDFLAHGIPKNLGYAELVGRSVSLPKSMALLLLIAGALLLLAGLFGVRFLGWLAFLVGAATVAALYLQIQDRFDTIPGNQYGGSVGGLGLVVGLVVSLLPRRRD